MKKTAEDPRDTDCRVNQWGKHRWARATKDQISKAHFIHVLRCRYCSDYMAVEFKRTVMPSGRVMVTQRAFAIEKVLEAVDATHELRGEVAAEQSTKLVDLPIGFTRGEVQPLAMAADGLDKGQIRGEGK